MRGRRTTLQRPEARVARPPAAERERSLARPRLADRDRRAYSVGTWQLRLASSRSATRAAFVSQRSSSIRHSSPTRSNCMPSLDGLSSKRRADRAPAGRRLHGPCAIGRMAASSMSRSPPGSIARNGSGSNADRLGPRRSAPRSVGSRPWQRDSEDSPLSRRFPGRAERIPAHCDRRPDDDGRTRIPVASAVPLSAPIWFRRSGSAPYG